MKNNSDTLAYVPLKNLKRFWTEAQTRGESFASNDDFVQRYIAFRNKEEMNLLREEFFQKFGSEGESIAAQPAFSEELNGGLYSYEDTKNGTIEPNKYFIGMQFSMPLIIYMMRRSLDTPEDICFKKYTQSVQNMADELKEPIYSIPTRSFIEELTAPYIARIKDLNTPHTNNTFEFLGEHRSTNEL